MVILYPIATLNVANANTLVVVFDDDGVPHWVLQVLLVQVVRDQPWRHASVFRIGQTITVW